MRNQEIESTIPVNYVNDKIDSVKYMYSELIKANDKYKDDVHNWKQEILERMGSQNDKVNGNIEKLDNDVNRIHEILNVMSNNIIKISNSLNKYLNKVNNLILTFKILSGLFVLVTTALQLGWIKITLGSG